MAERPISLPWKCNRSGDCCKQPVLLTRQEALELIRARPDMAEAPIFTAHPDPRYIVLGKPHTDCPFLGWELSKKGYLATCTVHAVRPYSCRRFGCFRPDPTGEPYEEEPVDPEKGRLGCANLSDRLTNRAVRRAYALQQRRAAQWALKHGWSQQDAPTATGSNVVFYSNRKLLEKLRETAPHHDPR